MNAIVIEETGLKQRILQKENENPPSQNSLRKDLISACIIFR